MATKPARRVAEAPADFTLRWCAGRGCERPRLFALLDRGALGPVTLMSAPAGSGKTMLLSSWLRSARAAGRRGVGRRGARRGGRDALLGHGHGRAARLGRDRARRPARHARARAAGRAGGVPAAAARGLERLSRPVLLVLDDLHHLRSEDALRGLEQLLARAPAQLRTFVVSRRDPKLGLHRLRLAGELTEIRGADLDFTAEEAGELMAAAGVTVAAGDVARLHERTEGWAAGLRLAAMSLARHDAPDRFVAEFSGSERTVADYLLGEVLASQPPEVRRLLLRTCILERVNGPLADLLTGRGDGTRLLHELEEANALVVAVDVGALLVPLPPPARRPAAARAAPRGAGRGRGAAPARRRLARRARPPVEAIRHAQLGEDWELAAELLGRHWVHLVLDGEEATLGSLLAGLPAELADDDAEVATITAADRLAESRWAEADALLAAAERAIAGRPGGAPAPRRDRAGDRAAAPRAAARRPRGGRRRGERACCTPTAPAGAELQALALMNLGIAETWTLRLADARGAPASRGWRSAARSAARTWRSAASRPSASWRT